MHRCIPLLDYKGGKVYNLVGEYTCDNHAGCPIKLSGATRLTFMGQSGCGVRLCPVTK